MGERKEKVSSLISTRMDNNPHEDGGDTCELGGDPPIRWRTRHVAANSNWKIMIGKVFYNSTSGHLAPPSCAIQYEQRGSENR